jgi:hypothetical protein
MKAQIHSKILAITAAVMLGVATTGGAAVARGGGGPGGGFGGAHIGSFGGAHVGGLDVHPMGMSGPHSFAVGPGIDDGGLGHTRVSHKLGDHHFRGLYGVAPLYDNTDCPWPADLTIESCPVGSDTE